MFKTVLTTRDVIVRALLLLPLLERMADDKRGRGLKLYGVPRGGVTAMYAICAAANPTLQRAISMVDKPEDADVFIDDIIDSGETMRRFCDDYPGRPFFALVDKLGQDKDIGWVVFPWEVSAEKGIEDNIVRLLQYIGEDPTREGLQETPARVAAAWSVWCSGYGIDPADELKTFGDGAGEYNEMVLVKDIPFYSHCEHHLAPFFGTASIAYIPQGRIVGLSKLSRVVAVFARRLQVQERMTAQIANALQENLAPKGVGVIVKARHLCMESRGISQQGHFTITSAMRGAMYDDPKARSEFLNLAR